MMDGQMRAEFEVWAESHGHRLDRDHANGGYYKDGDTDLAWCAWKDSRAALVVSLPEAFTHDQDGIWMIGRTEAKKAIEAAGVRVKL